MKKNIQFLNQQSIGFDKDKLLYLDAMLELLNEITGAYEEEIHLLNKENEQLKIENMSLRKQLSK